MSTDNAARRDLTDSTKPDLSVEDGPARRRGAYAERESQLQAARRQAERRHASVISQWLRRLDQVSGPAPK
jgi:hypothetical protein